MSDIDIIKRDAWGALSTTTKAYKKEEYPVDLIYVSLKSQLPECRTKEECINVLKEAQAKAIKTDNISDIPYNFIIAQDGSIYEGRGWDKKPHKAIQMEPVNFDPIAYDISFFGDFSDEDVELPDAQYKSLFNLLEWGVTNQYVLEEYELEPFHEETFDPPFQPGPEKFENIKPIEIKEDASPIPFKGPRGKFHKVPKEEVPSPTPAQREAVNRFFDEVERQEAARAAQSN